MIKIGTKVVVIRPNYRSKVKIGYIYVISDILITGYKLQLDLSLNQIGGELVDQRFVFTEGFDFRVLPEVFQNTEKKSEFPRLMWVRNGDSSKWIKRVVFAKKCNYYVAWAMADSIKGAENEVTTGYWNQAKELDELPDHTELTMQEIADKFGISVDKLKIKK